VYDGTKYPSNEAILKYFKLFPETLTKSVKILRYILITSQRDVTQSSLFIILQVHSTCFGCQPHPSSGIHKTVTTASGTGHVFCVTTSLQRGQAWPRWREVATQYRGLKLQFCVIPMVGVIDTRNM